MATTCAQCRHPIEAEPGESVRCPNCGTSVTVPCAPHPPHTHATQLHQKQPLVANPQVAPATTPPLQAVTAPPGTGRDANAYEAPVRAATIVAFVCGLVCFVPIITQVVAIIAAMIALGRRRRVNERVALAWIGLILGVVGLLVWITLLSIIMAAQTTTTTTTGGGFVWPGPPFEEDVCGKLLDWDVQAKQVYTAARAYKTDYNRWPASLDVLVGDTLPLGFKLAYGLQYRPPPPESQDDPEWQLLTSVAVPCDPDGFASNTLHQLTLSAAGEVKVIKAPPGCQRYAPQP